ncbi:hypothetical protein V8C37DRAFT_406643 [Trichoderma ceciliae]
MDNLFATAGENIEGNVEARRVAGRDINSWTRPWQHDNAFVRLPVQFLRRLLDAVLRPSNRKAVGATGLYICFLREILRERKMKFDRIIVRVFMSWKIVQQETPRSWKLFLSNTEPDHCTPHKWALRYYQYLGEDYLRYLLLNKSGALGTPTNQR